MKKLVNSFFILLLFLLLSSQEFTQTFRRMADTPGSSGWFWQYPKPQGNTLRDIYVFNKDTAIAVGDIGTVIKTTNGGTSWDVQHHAGGTSANLYSVHLTDALTGWTAGFDGTVNSSILKTTDGGINWVEVKPDTSYPIYAVWFVDSDTGFVFGDDGNLSRTTDGGKSWITKNMDDYIGGYLDVFSLNAVTFTSKDTGWVVGYGYYGNQIYKTTDCGRTWQWNQQIIFPIDFHPLTDIYFQDKNRGFIVGEEGAFIKTIDGGNSWQYYDLNQVGEDLSFNSIFFTDSVTGWITSSGDIGNYSYGDLILKTTDGGDNWAIIDSNKVGANNNIAQLFKVRFANKNTGWIVGENGEIYRTTNTGNDWISQRDDIYNFRSIYFPNENIGWAVGDSGVILHTTNGGDNWVKQYSANDLILHSITVRDSENVVVVGGATIKNLGTYMAAILETSNGGQTWERQTFDTIGYLNSICFSSNKIGWAVGYVFASNGILKTSNGGVTWYMQTNLPGGNKPGGGWRHVQFINENTGWVALYDSTLYKTTDGGNTWVQQTISANLNNLSFYFTNTNLGWALGDSYGRNNIFKTTDGGNIWTSCGMTYRGCNFSIDFVNETTGWITGYNDSIQKSIIKTTDGGSTWVGQDIPSNNLIYTYFINENTGWAVGNGIFKTTDGGGVVSVKEKSNYGSLPKQITLYQNYPNPFNPSTMISYQLPMISYVTFKVYDILGREVKTLINGLQQAGTHSVNFNASNLASGIYFYRLQVNEVNNNSNKNGNFIGTATSETKKMILIR